MELKFEGCINYQDVMDGSNRTFMELKSWVVGENVAGIKSSNRTFMELKFIRKLYSSMSRPVLIAPLWN